MNKLKNIGISALAGSLVSMSVAQAGGVAINGSWELSYTNKNSSKVTGNKFGMNKNLSFGGSGDLSDGGGVTWAYTVGGSDALGLSSASMNINMGGIATLAYDSGTGGYGANAVDNVVPTAWEEIDYGLSTGITDVGAVSASKGVLNLTVKAPTAGTGISISYQSDMGAGHSGDGGTSVGNGIGKGMDVTVDFVNYDAANFGMRFGMAGQIQLPDITCKDEDDQPQHGGSGSCGGETSATHKDNPYAATAYYTLKLGPLSIGTQATFKDPMDPETDGIKNKRSVVAGAALNFGNLSLSYGEAYDKYRYNDACRGGDSVTPNVDQDPNVNKCSGLNLDGSGGEYETINYSGYSAAINFGPVAIKGTKNRVSGWGENSSSTGENLDKTHSEINLSIAF